MTTVDILAHEIAGAVLAFSRMRRAGLLNVIGGTNRRRD
jgi:hypothetical protein